MFTEQKCFEMLFECCQHSIVIVCCLLYDTACYFIYQSDDCVSHSRHAGVGRDSCCLGWLPVKASI